MQCGDGTYCNGKTHNERHGCCNKHQGRARCPKNKPVMCATKRCANDDYCCGHSDDNCDIPGYGGPRQCGTF